MLLHLNKFISDAKVINDRYISQDCVGVCSIFSQLFWLQIEAGVSAMPDGFVVTARESRETGECL